jgi:hypothetical protein
MGPETLGSSFPHPLYRKSWPLLLRLTLYQVPSPGTLSNTTAFPRQLILPRSDQSSQSRTDVTLIITRYGGLPSPVTEHHRLLAQHPSCSKTLPITSLLTKSAPGSGYLLIPFISASLSTVLACSLFSEWPHLPLYDGILSLLPLALARSHSSMFHLLL